VLLPVSPPVVGEISNFVRAESGHVYFTLKDQSSEIRCVMWRSDAMKLRFAVQNGLALVAVGSVKVYKQRGQYQLYVTRLTPHGLGQLELAFRQLKDKLDREGLFDPDHKKPLPTYPLTIAVVTSPTGAAIRDILRTLNARWPVGRVMIYPVQVQGEGAAGQIASAVVDLNTQAATLGGIDVMIVGRGGGSLEDLWAFNEEVVARAIYASEIPIVSGVGHEIDITIADLVADVRAATPTAAAQTVTPLLDDVLNGLTQFHQRLYREADGVVSQSRREFESIVSRPLFAQPAGLLMSFAQQLDDVSAKLQGGLDRRLTELRTLLHNTEQRIDRISPRDLINRFGRGLADQGQRLRQALDRIIGASRRRTDELSWLVASLWPGGRLPGYRRGLQDSRRLLRGALEHRRQIGAGQIDALDRALRHSMTNQSKHLRHQLANQAERLEAGSYHQVINRGFTVTRSQQTGRIITSHDQVCVGEKILTQLKAGKLQSTVTETDEKSNEGP